MNPAIGALLLASPGIVVAIRILRRNTRIVSADMGGMKTRWLASNLEERVFMDLSHRFPVDRFVISAHMLLADVVGRERLGQLPLIDRQFAWRAHCDFVIVDRDDLRIVRAIEVNGGFHARIEQKVRDARKKALLARFGIALEIC